jgi:hypothetical protein
LFEWRYLIWDGAVMKFLCVRITRNENLSKCLQSKSQKRAVERSFGVTDDEEWPTPGRTIVVIRCDVWQRTGERTARTWHILSRLGCTTMLRLSGCGLMRGRIIMGEYSLRDRGRKTRRRVSSAVITTAIVWPEARG